MPHPIRIKLEGLPQYILQRGNNNQPCFFADADYRFYRDCLYDASVKYRCRIHAYVLMEKHVHMLITPESPISIAKCLQSVGRRYVQYINYTYQRTGTLWEGRYKSSLVDVNHYLLACCCYQEAIPVLAGLVDHPAKYPWSSFRYNGLGIKDLLVTQHDHYKALGSTHKEQTLAYHSLYQRQLTRDMIEQITRSVQFGRVIGTEWFKDEMEDRLSRSMRPLKRGRPRKEITPGVGAIAPTPVAKPAG
jgi:putative transposase